MVRVAGVDGMDGMERIGWVSGMGGGSGVDKKITIPPCPCLSLRGCFQSCRALGPCQPVRLRDFLLMLREQISQREGREAREEIKGEGEGERTYIVLHQGWPDYCANLLSGQWR